MEGLDEFYLKKAMGFFPDVFKPFFVNTKGTSPDDVIRILQVKVSMTAAECRVYDFLKTFLLECNSDGMFFMIIE